MDSKQNKSHLTIIFITVFLYLVGFGVMIPIMPIIGREFGADALTIGLLMSSYSLMQFLFAPFWGRLSDQRGRRPILLLCLAGEALSYLIFAFSSNLIGLFIARSLAGFFGASISTASASISDVTPSHERSRGMALIGAAFGLGFIVGPAIGGGLAIMGDSLFPEMGPTFGMHFAAGSVALICAITFGFAWKYLKETAHLSRQSQKDLLPRKNRLAILGRFLRKPLVGPLIGNFFLHSLAMSAMEATLILFAADRFNWGVKEVSFGFAYIGILSTLNQGFLVRKILPLLGEQRVLKIGLYAQIIGFALIAGSHSIPVLTLAMTILSLGNGFVSPSLLGSISLASPSSEQGEALGTAQGTASLGRIFGPAIGGAIYAGVSITSPFIFASLIALVSLIVVIKLGKKIPNQAQTKNPLEGVDEISTFQFNNLVYSRVNFVLLHDGIAFDQLFKNVELSHINQISIAISFEQPEATWISEMDKRGFPKDLPIVLFKRHGSVSVKSAQRLLNLRKTNVCIMNLDWEAFRHEVIRAENPI